MTTVRDPNADVPDGPTVKIGILQDIPIVEIWQPFLDGTRLAFDEATADGILDRPARFIIKEVDGLPHGDAINVVRAWQELVDEGAVAIIGPMISDNSLAVREYMDTTSRKVPTVTWSGTEGQYGEYMFAFGNGSLPEEPYFIAEAIAKRGFKTVGVVFERAAPGYGYTEFFADACRREDLEIVHTEGIAQVATEMTDAVANLMARKPDAIVYFGAGLPSVRMNSALAEAGWDPPRYMSTAFAVCYIHQEWMRGLRGWIGVDQYDEANVVGQAVHSRFEQRFGYRLDNYVPLLAYDVAHALALGIGYAKALTPVGVLNGLEKVKALPAASGSPGTRISFGKWTRSAWHGVGYLVLREVTDDGTGTRLVARWN